MEKNMIEKVVEIINIILLNRGRAAVGTYQPDLKLRDNLSLDSLDLAELTVRIENEFGIDIFEDGIVETVGEILEKLEQSK